MLDAQQRSLDLAGIAAEARLHQRAPRSRRAAPPSTPPIAAPQLVEARYREGLDDLEVAWLAARSRPRRRACRPAARGELASLAEPRGGPCGAVLTSRGLPHPGYGEKRPPDPHASAGEPSSA
ncbi:MAG: hypothetical protein R3F59_01990 [Myxococcota bacterium]